MLNESSYVVRYELSDGEQVERSYNHRAAWRLDRGFMVGPEHGWQHDPVTILEVERHPRPERPRCRHRPTLQVRRVQYEVGRDTRMYPVSYIVTTPLLWAR